MNSDTLDVAFQF